MHSIRPDIPMARRLLALLLPATIAACASHGAAGPVSPGQPLTMAPGREVALPTGGRLRYVGVTGDSRCPPGARCIHAGDATAAFAFREPGRPPEGVSINTAQQPPEAGIGAWRLRLLDLGHGTDARVTVRIDAAPTRSGNPSGQRR